MKTKSVLATLAASALCFALIPSSTGWAASGSGGDGGGGGGGGGGGTVAAYCGTITSIAASTVQLSRSGSGYSASPLQIRGEVFNCSIYLQSYWIDFDEPTSTAATCEASFSMFNVLTALSSGSRQGWTTSTNIAPDGVAAPTGCVGEHTVRAVLRSRSDGSVLHTVNVTYSVELR